MPSWIDTHCHLDAAEFDADRSAVRQQARDAGVAHCVMPAVERSNFDTVRLLAHFGQAPIEGVAPSAGAARPPKDALGLNHGYKPGFAWAAGPGRLTDQALAGVLWYQGESNALRAVDVAEYAGLMRLLVADWREQWRDPALPFLWCQLPSIDEPTRLHWPRFREVQRQLETSLKHTGMAVTLSPPSRMVSRSDAMRARIWSP